MASTNQVHYDKPLSNLAVAAFNTGEGGFIAPMIFPSVPVDSKSDLYYTLDSKAFLRIHDTKRAPKTKANRIEFDVSTDSYLCHNYALATDNALETLANADQALQLRENGSMLVTVGLGRDWERRVANMVTSLTNLGSGVALSAAQKFSDYVSSDPVGVVTSAQAFIRGRTGMIGNTAIIDYDTLTVLRRHPALLDMYKYTNGGEITDQQIASLFKVQRILVGNAIMDNSTEGQSTASITNIWGNNLIICHLAPPAGLKTTTFGLSMRYTPEGFPAPFAISRQSFVGAGTENVEVIEAQYFQAEKIVAKDLAYGISGTL